MGKDSAARIELGRSFHQMGTVNEKVNESDCNKVRKKEGSGQGWLVKTRVIYCIQINLNRCALCASSVHQLSRLSQHSLSVFVLAVSRTQTMRPSLHSVSLLECPPHGGFIWSLHANYCNQTQVFLILHLTHLLTAVFWVLLPAADFAEPRPPRHSAFFGMVQ